MLKSIVLTNFRSYVYQQVEFQPGVNVLVGPSGSGKTSLIQAIGCLFGDNFGRDIQLVRRGQKQAMVEIDLGEYFVRQSHGNGATAQLLDNNLGLLAEGKIEVAVKLADLLQALDLRELWRNVIYVPQFGVLNGLTESPSKRKAHFNAILGVEQYEKAWTALREPASLVKHQLELARQKRDMLAIRTAELGELEEQLQILGKQIEIETHSLAFSQGEHKTQKAELDQIAKQVAELKAKIAQAHRNRDRASRLAERIADNGGQIIVSQQMADRLKREIAGLSEAQTWLEENEDVPGKYRDALAGRAEQSESLHGKIVIEAEQAKALTQAIEVLKTGTCPVCLRPVDDDSILERYESDLAAADLRLHAAECQLNDFEAAMSPEIEALMQLNNTHIANANTVNRLPGLEQELAETKRKIDLLWNEMRALQGKIDQIGDIDSSPHEEALASLNEADKREKFYRLSTDVKLLEEKIKNLKERRQGAEAQLAALAEMTAEIESLEGKIAALECGLDKLGRVRDSYRKIAPALAARVVSLVSHEANKIFSQVWSHRSGKIEWSTDYAVSVHLDGIDHGFDVSGGQQVSAALALRLGLLSVLSPIRLLVLDEATMGALDSETARIVPELVGRIVERGFQVVAVDHGGLFDNVAVNRIQIQNVDGESRFS
jgi:DNA repair exonuclease SbcCD ATPase subunit